MTARGRAVCTTTLCCLLVAVSIALPSPKEEGFEVFSVLAQQQVAAVQDSNASHTRTRSAATIDELLTQSQQQILDFQDKDVILTKQLQQQFGASDRLFNDVEKNIRSAEGAADQKIQHWKNLSLPTKSLTQAKLKVNTQRRNVHNVHSMCIETAADVTALLKSTEARLANLRFIDSTLALGAHPKDVGNLAVSMDRDPGFEDSIERAAAAALLQEDEGKLEGGWFLSVPLTAVDSIHAAVAAARDRAYQLEETISGMFRQQPTITETTIDNNNNNNNNNKHANLLTGIQVSASSLIQQDLPELDEKITCFVDFPSVSVQQMTQWAVESVLNATAVDDAKQLPGGVGPSVFGRNLTDSEITKATLTTILSPLIPSQQGFKIEKIENNLREDKLSTRLTVTCPSHVFGAIAAAAATGSVDAAFSRRFPEMISNVRVAVASDPAHLQTLLSLGEEPDNNTPSTDCEGEGCGEPSIASVFSRMVSRDSETRDKLAHQREIMLQPCSNQLKIAQEGLQSAEKLLKIEQQKQTTHFGELEVLAAAQAVLKQTRRWVDNAGDDRMLWMGESRDNAAIRQVSRDGSLEVIDKIGSVVDALPSAEVIERRENEMRKRQQRAEDEAMAALVEDELKNKKKTCTALLTELEGEITKTENNLVVVSSLLDLAETTAAPKPEDFVGLLQSFQTVLEPQALLAVHGSSDEIRKKLMEAVQGILHTLNQEKEDQQRAQETESEACSTEINRLQVQLVSLQQSSS